MDYAPTNTTRQSEDSARAALLNAPRDSYVQIVAAQMAVPSPNGVSFPPWAKADTPFIIYANPSRIEIPGSPGVGGFTLFLESQDPLDSLSILSTLGYVLVAQSTTSEALPGEKVVRIITSYTARKAAAKPTQARL